MAAAAAAVERLFFVNMSDGAMRQWVEANPGRVNDRDREGATPLCIAAYSCRHSAVVWLLDEKGADVNATTVRGKSALYYAKRLDILTALLDRGADPTMADRNGKLHLMEHLAYASANIVERLLEDPRVRGTVNMQDRDGRTALHEACMNYGVEDTAALHLLLQAGANPTITDNNGQTPLALVRQRRLNHHATIALLERALAESEKASLVVKARRLAVAAFGNIVAPSCLQNRVARGQPLPRLLLRRVVLTPVAGGPNEDDEESRKHHSFYVFLLGVGGPKGEGIPRDVFRVVMDLLMPLWDPLRA